MTTWKTVFCCTKSRLLCSFVNFELESHDSHYPGENKRALLPCLKRTTKNTSILMWYLFPVPYESCYVPAGFSIGFIIILSIFSACWTFSLVAFLLLHPESLWGIIRIFAVWRIECSHSEAFLTLFNETVCEIDALMLSAVKLLNFWEGPVIFVHFVTVFKSVFSNDTMAAACWIDWSDYEKQKKIYRISLVECDRQNFNFDILPMENKILHFDWTKIVKNETVNLKILLVPHL